MRDVTPSTQHVSLRSPEEGRQLVLDVLRDNADSLLAVARRHSLCPDDAQDAYQRALEIFLRHARRLEAEGAPRWIHTVCKHEAMRLRASRQKLVSSDEVDFDRHEARNAPDADERVASFDRLTRSAEALQRLKPQEVRALWLRAQGLSYREIAEHCGWTYTKVNRCVTEGRASFLARYAGIEAGEECGRWAATLSALVDGEASAEDLAAVRPHLRNCGVCRATVRELHGTKTSIGAVLPLPATALAAGGHDRTAAAGGLVSRAWELLTGPLHERAVLSAAKLQTAVETASAGKMAAVAASAAALAGGGVAVDRAVVDAPAPHRAAARPASPPSARAAVVAAVSGPVRAGAPRAAAGRASAAPAPRTEFAASPGAAAREFGVDAASAASTGGAGAPASVPKEFAAASAAPPRSAPAPREFAPAPATAAEFGR